MSKLTKSERIRKLLKAGKSVAAVAKQTKVSTNYVYQVRYKDHKKKVKAARKSKKAPVAVAVEKVEGTAVAYDAQSPVTNDIDHPFHYTVGGIESWDYIEAKGLNYNLGTAVAYISRAQFKGTLLKDLRKAYAHLGREIKLREAEAAA